MEHQLTIGHGGVGSREAVDLKLVSLRGLHSLLASRSEVLIQEPLEGVRLFLCRVEPRVAVDAFQGPLALAADVDRCVVTVELDAQDLDEQLAGVHRVITGHHGEAASIQAQIDPTDQAPGVMT